MALSAGTLIATILRFDRKTTTYKIALIRAINDIAVNFPHLTSCERIAIPLRMIAEKWVAFYWPFVGAQQISQGRQSPGKQDLIFRSKLSSLRTEWAVLVGIDNDSDGFQLVGEASASTRWINSFPASFRAKYEETVLAIMGAVRKPIEYAGPGRHEIFPKPTRWNKLPKSISAVPGTGEEDYCLVVSGELWAEFCQLSLWVEALCIHEWCLLTETFTSNFSRSEAYSVLTERPGNRLPLTWERNQIDILIQEGYRLVCPWTAKPIELKNYDLDHILPISAYPINELWNLVPSDPSFNRNKKRDLIPGKEAMRLAIPRLAGSYTAYSSSPQLQNGLDDDVSRRFGQVGKDERWDGTELALRVGRFVGDFAGSRNLRTF